MSARIPSYRLHKPSNQAVVTLTGRDIDLGDFGSPESRVEYDRVIAEWLSNGRSRSPSTDLTVEEMNLGENRVATVVSVTSISGSAGPVFDLITSARFWPEWHPATRSVSGVTQRPYQLGDVIHERAHFAGLEIVVTWQVAEHARPSRVVLQALTSPARIAYSLEPKGGRDGVSAGIGVRRGVAETGCPRGW
jgi:hypothetical protein